MQLRGQRSRQVFYLDPEGLRLADGSVFAVADRDGARLVAKLLPASRCTAAQGARLLHMIAHPPADPLLDHGAIAVAWPLDLLLDEADHMCGYLMPLGEGRSIDQVYSPQIRRQALPGFHFGRLVETARHLAHAVRVLHQSGWSVFSSFAPDDILCRPRDARVTLLHADAFAEAAERGLGVDRMILASLLFSLLLEGAHPYGGVERGPYAPPEHLLANLPQPLRDLFIRAFQGEAADLPDAASFCAELDRLELSSCRVDPDHVYSSHLPSCPACQRKVSLPPLAPEAPAPAPIKDRQPLGHLLYVAGAALLLVVIVGLFASSMAPATTPTREAAPPASSPPSEAPPPPPSPSTQVRASSPLPDPARAPGREGAKLRGAPFPMVRIEPGTFSMGSPSDEPGRAADEAQHQVTITRRFALGATEVTQRQYRDVMGEDPVKTQVDNQNKKCSKWGVGDRKPVFCVTFSDAARFANRLSEQGGLQPCYAIDGEAVSWPAGPACTGYRLPTEAEWEYAARAGQVTRYAGGDDAGEVAWHRDNAKKGVKPVKKLRPNALGLYDMSGNVWEWVWDWYADYPAGDAPDPTGPDIAKVNERVHRGGSFRNEEARARVANRGSYAPTARLQRIGFRIARTLP